MWRLQLTAKTQMKSKLKRKNKHTLLARKKVANDLRLASLAKTWTT